VEDEDPFCEIQGQGEGRKVPTRRKEENDRSKARNLRKPRILKGSAHQVSKKREGLIGKKKI